MQKICLDKTVNLTRGVMNREMTPPDYVKVFDFCGEMHAFKFVDSKVQLPIEHLGLAMLSYNNAIKQYCIIECGRDEKTGEQTRTLKFEPLIGTDSHISDFLTSISPEALNWYSGSDGAYKMEYLGGSVQYKNPKDFNQCKVFNDKGEDLRELTITEAYRQAVRGYVANTVDGMKDDGDMEFVASLHDFMEQDALNFETLMDELRTQSTELIIHPEKDSGEDEGLENQGTENPLTEGSAEGGANSLGEEAIKQHVIPLEVLGEGSMCAGSDSVPPEQ